MLRKGLAKRPRPQGPVPRYAENEQRTILRFLVATSIDHFRAIDSLTKMKGSDKTVPFLDSQIIYHQDCISCLKRAAHKTLQKQRHLLEINNEQITEVLQSWGLQLTILSRLVPLSKSVTSLQSLDRNLVTGDKLESMPKGSFETHAPKLLTV